MQEQNITQEDNQVMLEEEVQEVRRRVAQEMHMDIVDHFKKQVGRKLVKGETWSYLGQGTKESMVRITGFTNKTVILHKEGESYRCTYKTFKKFFC